MASFVGVLPLCAKGRGPEANKLREMGTRGLCHLPPRSYVARLASQRASNFVRGLTCQKTISKLVFVKSDHGAYKYDI